MKTMEFLLVFSFFSLINELNAQNHNLPDIDIYTLDAERLSASMISNTDQPMVIVFWKRSDKHSLEQLSNINEEYEETLKDKNIKVIGICLDASGNMESIKPFIYGNNFGFEIYIDRNGDLKRALNITDVPFIILIDKDNNAYSQYVDYCGNVGELIQKQFDEILATLEENK